MSTKQMTILDKDLPLEPPAPDLPAFVTAQNVTREIQIHPSAAYRVATDVAGLCKEIVLKTAGQTRLRPMNLEATQHQTGGGSNARACAPSEARAKRVNVLAQSPECKADGLCVPERGAGLQAVTAAGHAVATLNSATQRLAPSAAPAHFQTT